MKPMIQAEFAAGHERNHKGTQHGPECVADLMQLCHPGRGLAVRYVFASVTIDVTCAKCGDLVARVGVAKE